MRRIAAICWLAVVVLNVCYAGISIIRGLPLQTNILSLLPSEEQDHVVQQAKDLVTRELMQRIVLLVSHEDPAQARSAAALIQDGLISKGFLLSVVDVPSMERIKELGSVYFPYRSGLLSDGDREVLQQGRGDDIVRRSLSQVYGFSGTVDGRLIARDPFLLFPAFLNSLPVPMSKLRLDDGFLSTHEDGKTNILLTGILSDDSASLTFQRKLIPQLDQMIASVPDVSVLRLGAIFFAYSSANLALSETAVLSFVSLGASFLLLILAFRSARPLFLAMLAIGVGMTCALSLCLVWFGEIHVAAQLFGASLIGVAVDYALIYFGQAFCLHHNVDQRLRRVFPGLLLGMLTTVIGYATLALSPFPGLHQVALFSCVGLIASFLTVVLWFPYFDRLQFLSLPVRMRRIATSLWQFWSHTRFSSARFFVFVGFIVLCISGYARIFTDDDIRNQQSLNAGLLLQQSEIVRIAGFSQSNQFFIVQGDNTESVMRLEERLADRLAVEVNSGRLVNFVSPSRFVPSAERQEQNRQLVYSQLLKERLQAYKEQIGLDAVILDERSDYLGLERVLGVGAFGFMPKLVLFNSSAGVGHIVVLEGVRDPRSLRMLANDIPGIRFVDPTADYSSLFAVYRQRALVLIFVSAGLMFPALAWRYGWGGGLRVTLPPVLALVLTPACMALLGQPFTFFSAMALVLVLSMGVDYAVFCAEDSGSEDPAVLISVALAMLTALLSFGMLAMSVTAAVKSFGLTMAIGLPLAYLLAPIGGKAGIVSRRVERG